MYAILLFIRQHAMSVPVWLWDVGSFGLHLITFVPDMCWSWLLYLLHVAQVLVRSNVAQRPRYDVLQKRPRDNARQHTQNTPVIQWPAVSCYKTVCKTGQRGEQQGSVCMSGCSWPWQQGRVLSAWTLWACWLPSRWWHQRPGSFSYTMRWFHFSPQGMDRSLEGSVHPTTDGGNRGERILK